MNATSMIDQYPTEVRAEARRIADRTGAQYEDLPRIEAAVAYDFFRRAIQPWQDTKVRMFSDATCGQISCALVDGKIVPMAPMLTADTVEALHQIDDLIAAEARRYGLSSSLPETPLASRCAAS